VSAMKCGEQRKREFIGNHKTFGKGENEVEAPR